jgi:hypothetical protein
MTKTIPNLYPLAPELIKAWNEVLGNGASSRYGREFSVMHLGRTHFKVVTRYRVFRNHQGQSTPNGQRLGNSVSDLRHSRGIRNAVDTFVVGDGR